MQQKFNKQQKVSNDVRIERLDIKVGKICTSNQQSREESSISGNRFKIVKIKKSNKITRKKNSLWGEPTSVNLMVRLT